MNSDGTTIVALCTHNVNTVHSKCGHNVAENTPYPTTQVDPKRLAQMVASALRILRDHEQNAQGQVLEVSR